MDDRTGFKRDKIKLKNILGQITRREFLEKFDTHRQHTEDKRKIAHHLLTEIVQMDGKSGDQRTSPQVRLQWCYIHLSQRIRAFTQTEISPLETVQ